MRTRWYAFFLSINLSLYLVLLALFQIFRTMKNLIILFAILIVSSTFTIAQDNQSLDIGVVVMWEGGESDDYYYENDFNGHDFGTLNELSNLYLKSGQALVSKDEAAGGDIVDADMYYRVYKSGDTPDEFINVSLPWHSEWAAEELTNQMWWNDAPDEINLNLLEGVVDGTYFIEVYFTAEAGEGTIYTLNNVGGNYIAQFTYSGSTNIENANLSNVCSVFPNPATDEINISIDNTNSINSVTILNSNSVEIHKQASSRGVGFEGNINIPTNGFASGTYFIRIETDKGVHIERLVITK